MSHAHLVVGVDAGGTSTRAAVVDGSGRCQGVGRSGPGNPSAHGVPVALASMTEAIGAALSDVDAARVSRVVIAMAGDPEPLRPRLPGIAGLPPDAPIDLTGDVLAMFVSGTPSRDGGVVLAGTGSVAARVQHREAIKVVGGLGWLVSDVGSGFSVGREIARAVIADLEGLGPPTRLTVDVCARLGLASSLTGRAAAEQMSARLRRDPPAAVARLAPLALAAAGTAVPDPVADLIVSRARSEIAGLVSALRMPPAAPLVLGGGFLVHGLLPASRDDALAGELTARAVHLVVDGLVGACALALGQVGLDVDTTVHARLRNTITATR